jgi:hypothetical protein
MKIDNCYEPQLMLMYQQWFKNHFWWQFRTAADYHFCSSVWEPLKLTKK